MTLLLLTMLASATATSVPEPPLGVATVVDNMQKRYDQAKDFRARFTQTYTRSAIGRTTVSTGQLAFKKPGRMRWDYAEPEPRMFLSNGQVLWMYEPSEKQAFKQDLKTSQLPAALAFLMGKGKIVDEFDVSWSKDLKLGRKGDYCLALSPKQPQAAYKTIVFVVDPAEYLVRESLLVDGQGNANHFVFDDLQVNAKVSDALFRWSPPAGTRVVDTGQLGKQAGSNGSTNAER